VEASADAFILLDGNLDIVASNPAGGQLLGLPKKRPGSGGGPNLRSLLPGFDGTTMHAALLRVLKSGEPFAAENLELSTKSGSRRLNVMAVRMGTRVGIAAHEVTGSAQAREETGGGEGFFQALVENAMDALVVVGPDGSIRYKSASVEQMLGYRTEDDIGRSFLGFVHPDDLELASEAFAQLSERTGPAMRRELRVKDAGGGWRVLEVVGTNLLANAVVRGIVASFRDITEWKKAQDEVRDSESRFRSVLDNSFDMVYRLNLETGWYDYVSPSSRQVVGYDPEEFIELGPKHAVSLIHPDDTDRVSGAIIDLMEQSGDGARASTIEYRIHNPELGYRWVADNISVIRGRSNAPVAVVGNMRDITERRMMQQVLEESEEHFRALIENSLEAIAIVDANGLLAYESPSFERLLGYKSEDHLGKSPFAFIHEEDLSRVMDTFSRTAENPGGVVREELRVWHKDGSLRIVEVVGQNLLQNPAVQGIVANIRDITDRRQAEEVLQQLYRQERELRQQLEEEMKRRVEFTRALAHELKTPLTSVLASSDLLAAELREEPLQTLARNIWQGASNLDERIDELLDLAKGEVGVLQLKLEKVGLADLLRQTAEAMSPLASRLGQSLLLNLPQSLPAVRGDAVRLQQVLNNLLSNAFKFTPFGGSVKLGARVRDNDVVVEVKDTGRGISSEEQKLLFEPYRRLQKDSSGGLGLGLALSRTLVELHGGQIWVKSSVGRGSTFGFSLPLEGGERQAEGEEKAAKLWKVLIIEDDPQIVSFVSVAFQMRWPEAELISTNLGEEGLDLVETENPDLVILDIGLPDADGFDILRQIRLFSSVPVVILTVKTDEADMVRGLEWGADDYVVKPFRQLELLARLKVQLRRQAPADEEAPVTYGALRLDPSTFQLNFGGREIGLTLVEGRIMQYLMRNAGHVVTHSRLAESVWGEDHPGALDSLRVYIRHLREKLEEDPSNPKLILTKVGVGYMLAKQV